jgi:hypothetical protein
MKECDISLPRDAPRPPPNREMSYVIKLNLLPLAFCRCVSCVPLSLFFAISVILYYLVSYLWCDGDTNADFLLNLESEFLDTTNKRHRSSFLDMHMTRETLSISYCTEFTRNLSTPYFDRTYSTVQYCTGLFESHTSKGCQLLINYH